jgi:hypothetical protein
LSILQSSMPVFCTSRCVCNALKQGLCTNLRRNFSPPATQEQWFEEQVQGSRCTGLVTCQLACCTCVSMCICICRLNLSCLDKCLVAQVQLAIELRKPLFLHCRDAAERFTASLKQHTLTAPAVAHCFTGTRPELEACLDLGLHIGITGWVRPVSARCRVS